MAEHETDPTWTERVRTAAREVIRPTLRPLGRRTWVIPGCHIPPETRGREPEDTSRDELSFLNTANADAAIHLTVYYPDREPVGPYRFTIPARRTRIVRFNDLLDPEAITLDTDFAAVVDSDVPVIVHFHRFDSGRDDYHSLATLAFPADS